MIQGSHRVSQLNVNQNVSCAGTSNKHTHNTILTVPAESEFILFGEKFGWWSILNFHLTIPKIITTFLRKKIHQNYGNNWNWNLVVTLHKKIKIIIFKKVPK